MIIEQNPITKTHLKTTYNDLEWLDQKLKMANYDTPVYKLSSFGCNSIDAPEWFKFKYTVLPNLSFPVCETANFEQKNMEAEFQLSENGLCLMNVGIGKGEYPIEYVAKVAMIDTGSSRSVISKELVELLQLDISEETVTIKGYEGSQQSPYTTISMLNHELKLRVPMNVVVVHNTPEGVDLLLGSDFLKIMCFTRNGNTNTFELKY